MAAIFRDCVLFENEHKLFHVQMTVYTMLRGFVINILN